MKKDRKLLNLFLVLGSLVLLTTMVGAAGVTAPYWDGNPLYMKAGTSETVTLTLQNMAEGSADMTFNAAIEEGSEIASLSGTSYSVPFGVKDVAVPVVITIPENPSASQYTVKVSFTEVVTDGTGQVQLGMGLTKSFDVMIVDVLPSEETETEISIGGEPEKAFPWSTVLIILAIIAVIIVLMSLKKKK